MQTVDKRAGRVRVRVGIDMVLCKKCGLCIDLCGRGVFDSDGGAPLLVREENCNNCMVCELICPDFAINLEVMTP